MSSSPSTFLDATPASNSSGRPCPLRKAYRYTMPSNLRFDSAVWSWLGREIRVSITDDFRCTHHDNLRKCWFVTTVLQHSIGLSRRKVRLQNTCVGPYWKIAIFFYALEI